VEKAIKNTLKIERHPKSSDKSLKAWSAADELLIQEAASLEPKSLAIYHDTFGYLSCFLSEYQPNTITTLYSQQEAILKNLTRNHISADKISIKNPLENLDTTIDLALMKIPKSVDLFEVYLNQIHQNADINTVVYCGFMTRNFSSQALKIAEKYFMDVSQSKAYKKARILILKGVKAKETNTLTHDIQLSEKISLKQYFGVFSAHHIDYASQFLMQSMEIDKNELKILDIGCGNGVLAYHARQLSPSAELYLTDDSYLAMASAKLNIADSSSTHFYCSNHLKNIEKESIHLAISNPPFHFEYENNIDITLGLFNEIHECLMENGRFLMVANKHLNYATHLKKIFYQVKELNSNEKFVVYECIK